MNNDFNKWAFEQVQVKGNVIVSLKDETGRNVRWINTTTNEEFTLDNKKPQ